MEALQSSGEEEVGGAREVVGGARERSGGRSEGGRWWEAGGPSDTGAVARPRLLGTSHLPPHVSSSSSSTRLQLQHQLQQLHKALRQGFS